jgi:anaerobic selenocysteine-containing dehydrogenase
VNVIISEGLVDLGRLADHVTGLEAIATLAAPFTPEAVTPHTGIAAVETRRMARELAHAERAAVYGRIGTTTQAFGTLASWLVDVLNIITGNLDREGGVMFPLAAAGQSNSHATARKPWRHGRWASRVRALPEVMGELPVATLAEEILTPGLGQVRPSSSSAAIRASAPRTRHGSTMPCRRSTSWCPWTSTSTRRASTPT